MRLSIGIKVGII